MNFKSSGGGRGDFGKSWVRPDTKQRSSYIIKWGRWGREVKTIHTYLVKSCAIEITFKSWWLFRMYQLISTAGSTNQSSSINLLEGEIGCADYVVGTS